MKIMLCNKTYDCHINPSNPCRRCTLKYTTICAKIPTQLCIPGGGFKPSDTKIFTL